MKALTQVVIPIALVIAIVFGVTILSNYSTTAPKQEASNAPLTAEEKISNEIPLRFGVTQVERKPDYYYLDSFQSEYEVGQAGAFDYWFQNRNPQPASLRLGGLSCQCQSMEVGLVSKEGWKQFQQRSALSAIVQSIAIGAPNLLAAGELLRLSTPGNDTAFIALGEDTPNKLDTVEVPAMDPAVGPSVGFVRLHWKGKTPVGPKRLSASMLMSLPKAGTKPFELQVATMVLPIVRVWPVSLDFEELLIGSSRTREFYCVSSTRAPDEVLLKVTDSKPNPCVVIQPPQLLNDTERQQLQARLSRDWSENLTIRSAWKVQVTVNERIPGHQMDLGPINRSIVVSTQDASTDIYVQVKGFIRGDVRIVGGGNDKDIIDLGRGISSERGRQTEVRLVTDRTEMELELLKKEHSPEYLDVQLTPLGVNEGKKQWSLRVRIPEKKLYGKLNADAGIMLQTKDTPPRRIRIPVRGETYDTSGDF